MAATLIVVTLISSQIVSPRPTTAPPSGVVVRARLLAALNEASNDVVEVAGQRDVSGSGLTSCPATSWFYPFDAQPGGEFREHVEGRLRLRHLETAVDITVKTVTPFVLPTPASLAKQTPAVHVSESDGVSVCGTGTFIGYHGRGPTGTTWRSVGRDAPSTSPGDSWVDPQRAPGRELSASRPNDHRWRSRHRDVVAKPIGESNRLHGLPETLGQPLHLSARFGK